jgi:hypothetical protein
MATKQHTAHFTAFRHEKDIIPANINENGEGLNNNLLSKYIFAVCVVSAENGTPY